MTEILWGPYQEHHIAVRHGVTAEQFEAAWMPKPMSWTRLPRIDQAAQGRNSRFHR